MEEQVKYRFCRDCPDYWECGRGFDLRKRRKHCGKAALPSHKKVVTNADRIRAMSDEELLKFIEMIHYNGRLGLSPYYGWDGWLKKEEEEETCTEKS